MTGFRSIVAIGMGANLPIGANSPIQTLAGAVAQMPRRGLVIRAISRFFATPCFPAGAGPDYVNAALLVRSTLDSGELLEHLHAIETGFGRQRKQRWGMRTLDLDILWHGDRVLPDRPTVEAWMQLAPDDQANRAPDRLILPHPRLHDRAFALVPLADIAPDWRHPVLGLSVREMLDRLPAAARDEVTPI